MVTSLRNLTPGRKQDLRLAAALAAPAVIIMLVVAAFPIVRSFWISLTTYDLKDASDSHAFVGFANYLTNLSDPGFWHSLRVTALFVVIAVTTEIVLALALALFLDRPFRGQGFMKILVLLPWAIPPVVSGVMWKWILNPSYGAANGLLSQLGIIDSYIIWLGEPMRALFLVAMVDVWKETPFIMLIILAALQSVPKELYEAAKVDGASAWKTLSNVTLPLIRPTLFVVISLRTIWALKSFDLIYTITSGGPSEGTTVLGYYAYLESFVRLRLDRGASVSFIMAAIVMVVVLLYQRALYREVAR
ncbi:MAG TPA: sugar ABC transporter permease [Actinobacteria bacterium]|nr:sugar ABC transporter permease [Actinomycetota bacterium]